MKEKYIIEYQESKKARGSEEKRPFKEETEINPGKL